MKKVKREASIPYLLMQAGNELAYATFGAPDGLHEATRTMTSLVAAKAIIEIVEVLDCGSAGGFGKRESYPILGLYNRWHWLCDKYWPDFVNAKDEGNGQCYFDYAMLEKYYRKG